MSVISSGASGYTHMVASTSSMDERTSGHNETVGRQRYLHFGMKTSHCGTSTDLDELWGIERKTLTKGMTLTDARCRWPREHRQERGYFDRI